MIKIVKNWEVNITVKKRKVWVIIAILAVILVGSIWTGIQLKNGRDYFFVFRQNWSIAMPTNAKQLYETQSEANIHGDGERYHVFQYDKTPEFPESMKPISAVPEEEREDVLKILSSGITVDKKYLPDFDGATLGMKAKKEDNSRVYLYYVESSKTLYMIEDFL